ncbi:hypothetical protein [Streptomyces sp. NRRL B-1347]|uniref:hypothetical protein n=1 Tax=Streptomyces sp. NRRL B-1347 TaxID=1476877 RepID=UPI0004CA5A10
MRADRFGRLLLAAVADAEGRPAYLESSKADNIPFYEHFGFAVRRELSLPLDARPVWLMWRDAR